MTEKLNNNFKFSLNKKSYLLNFNTLKTIKKKDTLKNNFLELL